MSFRSWPLVYLEFGLSRLLALSGMPNDAATLAMEVVKLGLHFRKPNNSFILVLWRNLADRLNEAAR